MATAEPLRKSRERELVAATRALFDERGAREAPVEEIAKAVGIARGLIYRQFSSKDELYVLTVTDYLAELAAALEAAIDLEAPPASQLAACAHAYATFCQRYPAFLDAALALMHGPAEQLHDRVSESVWLRLGEGISSCVGRLAEILRAGAASGDLTVEDPDYVANVLWTQTLGVMHLARMQVGIRRPEGRPGLFPVQAERVVATCVEHALLTAGAA